MAKKTSSFTIREADLATALEITHQELVKIIQFFDSDPNDQWDLRESDHFIYLNKSLKEMLFSEQGAYAVAKYMDENVKKVFWHVSKTSLLGIRKRFAMPLSAVRFKRIVIH